MARPGLGSRLTDSLETALKLGEGTVAIEEIGGETHVYSEKFACAECGISLPEIEPRCFLSTHPMAPARTAWAWDSIWSSIRI